MEKVPDHGSCFVCGANNPKSIGVEWYLVDGNQISTNFVFTDNHQGPPRFAHGGATAAILDEAMGLAIWYSGYHVVTAKLSVNYRKPVPLGTTVQINGRLSERTDRRIIARGEILLPDGSIAVSAEGLYAEAIHFYLNGANNVGEVPK